MNFDNVPVPDWFKPYAPLVSNFIYGALIMALGWMISKWAYRLTKTTLNKAKTEESLSRFLAAIAQYIVLAAAVIAALNRVGIQTTSLVAVMASAGLAVGLALQGSLSNFASGVLILGFRPFVLDDFVEIGGKSGTVEDIGLFMTRLLTPNNEIVLVPNSEVTGSSITNYTAKGVRRTVVDIGVAYGVDVRRVKEILEDVAKGVPNTLEDPAPSVILANFGASSLDFQVRSFAKVPDFFPMIAELKLRIYERLEQEGIEIPFNQIVVHQAEESQPEPT
ncbi:MAG TPA: mechanosensitive ion channel family protein [Phycisphaerales bacterium]|nr:mechanosensitive ion channel family protein [Phycisphaerales bacterium]